MTTRETLARRVVGFDQTVRSRMVDARERHPWGTASRTPSLPLVYHLSRIDVERPMAPPEVATAIATTFDGLPHEWVSTARPEVAWSLGPALEEGGYSLDRTVYMVHDGQTPPRVSPVGFDVVDVERAAVHRRAATAEEPWGRDPEVQAQFVARDRRLAERVDTTFVQSHDDVAACHVYRHGTVAQIEAVTVLAEARGQGLGEGLLAAALQRCAGAGTVFLIADADDWPRRWYADRGFVPVASAWEWNRTRSA